jgi:hypothetical protein
LVSIFLIFVQLSTEFTSFSQSQTLFKKLISKKSLKVLDSLRVGPCFALKTLERMGKTQLGPRGAAGGGLVEIRRARRRSWSGKQLGRSTWSHGCDLGQRKGGEDHVWFEDWWMVASGCDE